MNSPRTTLAGVMAGIAALLVALSFTLDGDPKTNPDWAGVVNALTPIGIALFGGGVAALGFAAQDAPKKVGG